MASLKEIRRAIARAHAAVNLTDEELIRDAWTAGMAGRAPTPKEILYGPVLDASGAGAEAAIRHYAHPARQHGVTATVETLSRDLDSVHVTMRSMAESIATLTEGVAGLIQHVGKSAANQADWPDGGSGDDDDDDAERKAKARLRALKRAVRAADAEVDDADDERARKRAARKAQKAREEALAAMSDQIGKAVAGVGTLTSDVTGLMNFLLARGRSGGVPPVMRKAGAPISKAHAMKSATSRLNEMRLTGTVSDREFRQATDMLRAMSAPTPPDQASLRRRLATMSGETRGILAALID